MSEPFSQNESTENQDLVDKTKKDKAVDFPNTEPTSLTFTDLDTSGISQAGMQAQRDSAAERSLASLDIEFGSGQTGTSSIGGQRPGFPLRKAVYVSQETDKSLDAVRPLIQDFLKTTESNEADHSLSQDELRLLALGREALSNATNTHDAVSEAVHLARMYQHMRYIEEAKLATELSLGIDPDSVQGKQLFRDLERMHQTELGSATKPVQIQPLSKSNLRKRILSLTGGKVIVLGDLLIDELLEGKPERISREAPVLILEHVDTELIPGGAANTANNISALGGNCHAIGVCGNDEYANQLGLLFDRVGIQHSLVRDATRPTTVKTRILSKSHSFKQQLLRLDRISHEKIDASIEGELLSKLKAAAGNYSALILSDYRAGVMTDALIRGCRAIAAEKNLLLIVDAQDDFARFQDVSLLTPNQPDTEKAVGFTIDSRETLQRAGDELMMITGSKALLITRGSEGMVLFQQNEPMTELPAFNKSEVFDVSGAGDTVVATMALAMVTGSTFIEAMALGNLAAGIVVKKPGTAITSQKEMLENLDLLKIVD
jgi:rfaE bifunctional protein kinase chain/domain